MQRRSRHLWAIRTLSAGLLLSACGHQEEHSGAAQRPSPAQVAACEANCDQLAAGQRPECEGTVIAPDSCKRAIELATSDCKRICQPRE